MLQRVVLFLGMSLCIAAAADEFPAMTTVSADSGNASTSVTPLSQPSATAIDGMQSQLLPLATPPQVPAGPPAGTAILGQLVGAVTANKAANSTGNVAAINATQNNLINTEATMMSSSMTAVLNQLVKSQS